MKDEMVRVLLYENGEVEIESAENNQATQHMFFRNEKGCGDVYFCKKGMEAFYLKRMLSKRKKELTKRIKELKAAETRVNKFLSKIQGDKQMNDEIWGKALGDFIH